MASLWPEGRLSWTPVCCTEGRRVQCVAGPPEPECASIALAHAANRARSACASPFATRCMVPAGDAPSGLSVARISLHGPSLRPSPVRAMISSRSNSASLASTVSMTAAMRGVSREVSSLRSSMLQPGKSQRESNPNSPIKPRHRGGWGARILGHDGHGAWWHEPRVRARRRNRCARTSPVCAREEEIGAHRARDFAGRKQLNQSRTG